MKNKILVIIFTFVLCFSLLIIPSFAAELYPDTFTFVSDLEGFDYLFDVFDFDFNFIWDNQEYLGMSVDYGSDYWFLKFLKTDGSFFPVYDSGSGWLINEPVVIQLDAGLLPEQLYESLLGYGEFDSVSIPWYDSIYDIIKTAVFGDRSLNSSEDMSITLVALVMSIGAVLLPVLIILRIGKTLLMSRYM